VESRQASTSSWFQGVSSSPSHSRSFRPNTEPRSTDISGAPARLSRSVRLALLVLRGYKLLISPCFSGSCRFLPSCADYAAEAFRTRGFTVGLGLTLHRLGRCHPFARAGHDPVPPYRIGS